MAATLVSTPTTGHLSGGSSIELTRTPGTSGNLFTIISGTESNSNEITGISGTHDNGWTHQTSDDDPFGDYLDIWYAYTDGTGDADVVTITYAAGNDAEIFMFEATGMATSSPLQVGTFSTTTSSGTSNSPTVTPTVSGPVISAIDAENVPSTSTMGWTAYTATGGSGFTKTATFSGTGGTPASPTWTFTAAVSVAVNIVIRPVVVYVPAAIYVGQAVTRAATY